MGKFSDYERKWSNCISCALHKCRNKIVLAKGKLPCDVLFVGEAPGLCIGGNSLVEVAFRDKSVFPKGIPIKELVGKTGLQVYSYNHRTNKLDLGSVVKVWKTGTKSVYRVTYFWWGAKRGKGKGNGKIGGRCKYFGSLVVTDNHPFLLRTGTYKSIKQGLKVGDSLMPFLRYGRDYSNIGISSNTMVRDCRFLLEHKIGRALEKGEECHHEDRNKLNDQYENIKLETTESHARIHGFEDNPMSIQLHRETHLKAVRSESYRANHRKIMSAMFSKTEVRVKRAEQNKRVAYKTSATLKEKYKDPIFYFNYLKNRKWKNGKKFTLSEVVVKFRKKFPKDEIPENHEIISIRKIGIEDVYDMEVEEHHNFAVNGVFVHNSEDALGVPFIGPAGRLLDQQIKAAEERVEYSPKKLWTNLTACIPKIPNTNRKAEEPLPEEIEACDERLMELIDIAKPKRIVCVGDLAIKRANKQEWKEIAPVLHIRHPAFILRANPVQRNYENQKVVVQLTTLFKTLQQESK